ncbi:PriCT-2 domain-containing protein [Acuticoccus sp. M5D2P5]|uniref:PriCT-2 domain-containing protein n=1 Tax=Acuticoccus kalidii TaxID=2910977 RepID=UPI001F217886|nr:PriCT-2 domain-containing protein [Acuticoccus kalidii]MCF3934327.1 PriCT-2 domain-containing protein [Acuticoccus kalidii]
MMAEWAEFDRVPALVELAHHRQWVCWRYERKDGKDKPDKVPIMPRTGFRASSTNPTTWDTYEAAKVAAIRRGYDGVGFVVSAGDEFTAIDLDRCVAEDGTVAGWAQELLDHRETYAEVSPSGTGIRMFTRSEAPTIARSKACGVEIYTSGRFVTVTGDAIGAVGEIGNAPKTIAALVARYEAWREEERQAAPREPSAPLHEVAGVEELAELLTYLDADCGYHEWVEVGMAVHDATGGGSAGLALWDEWSGTGGDAYPGGKEIARKWRSFTKSGITSATIADMARTRGADLAEISSRHRRSVLEHDDFDPSKMEVPKRQPAKVVELPAPAEMERKQYVEPLWCQPGGLIGEIADWILETSTQPNRPLAVASAISIVGTLCGRHVATPTGCGTQLYVACIGQTAIGKDRPLKAVMQVMDAIGVPMLAGTAKFKSESALERDLQASPCYCSIADEIGHTLLARISSGRASTHEAALGPLLRELWSASFSTLTLSSRAMDVSGQPKRLEAPAFSILGASTEQQFYGSLGSGAIENGTMNRFTIVKAAPRTEFRSVDINKAQKVPANVVENLQTIMPQPSGDPVGKGVQLGVGANGYAGAPPHITTIAWADGSVWDAYRTYVENILHRIDKRASLANYMGRTAEMAIRLATIHAVSRAGLDATVAHLDLEWGMCIAEESAHVMMTEAAEHIHSNEQQGRYMLVRSLLRRHGPKVTRNQLVRAIKGRISARDLEPILRDLDDSGFIEIGREQGRTKTTIVYTVLSDFEDIE